MCRLPFSRTLAASTTTPALRRPRDRLLGMRSPDRRSQAVSSTTHTQPSTGPRDAAAPRADFAHAAESRSGAAVRPRDVGPGPGAARKIARRRKPLADPMGWDDDC